MLVVTWRKDSAGRLPAPATGWWFAPRRSNGRAMCSRCCSRWRTAAMPFSGETRRAWRSPRLAACARTRTAALPGRRRPRPNAGEIEAPMPRAGDRRGKRSPAPDPRGCGLTYINVRAGAGRGEWLYTVGAGGAANGGNRRSLQEQSGRMVGVGRAALSGRRRCWRAWASRWRDRP